jgi:hypothetical protein
MFVVLLHRPKCFFNVRLFEVIPLLPESVSNDESAAGTISSNESKLKLLKLPQGSCLARGAMAKLVEILVITDSTSLSQAVEEGEDLRLILGAEGFKELSGRHSVPSVLGPFDREGWTLSSDGR